MNLAFLAAALLAQPGAAAPAAPAAAAQETQQQQTAAPRPSPELSAAVQEFGKCMEAAVAAVPATDTPEAGAKTVAATCSKQLETLTSTAESWIAGADVSAEQKADMRKRLATVGDGLEARTIQRIRELRAAARPVVPGR